MSDGCSSIEKFCNYQIKYKEDADAMWTCTAHLADARAFICPYKSFRDFQRRGHRCVDVELILQGNKEKKNE